MIPQNLLPLVPAEKLSTNLTVLCSKGIDVPPLYENKIKISNLHHKQITHCNTDKDFCYYFKGRIACTYLY